MGDDIYARDREGKDAMIYGFILLLLMYINIYVFKAQAL